ncbi:MAG: prepilin peptidase [Acidimicrobiaceae bacterium]|nr:prepilin peptidase [Ilumatobacter sp.]MCB9381438.1 prepilin peptidase [Acidimicrobiaceae bacterium]
MRMVSGGVTGGVRGAFTGGPEVAGFVPLAVRWGRAWHAAPPGRRRWFAGALATCPLLAASTAAIGHPSPAAALAGTALTATGTVIAAAALVDAHEHRLPNSLTALAGALAVVGALAAPRGGRIGPALLGGLIAGAAMLVVHLSRGVGLGDVKLAAVVGASCGTSALAAAPLAIAVAAIAAAATGLLTRRTRLPLGPSLWAGWAVATAAAGAGWAAGGAW